MKQNDWIIANINNPDFTASDFKNIGGLSLENTQLLPADSYLKSEKITNNDLFKDDSGQFNKDKFQTFYNEQSKKFENFAADSALDNYEYGFWDVFQKPNSRVRNPEFNIDKVANPTHQSTGVIGINLQGERTKSDFELAEKQKIFDWKNERFTDETPESSALFTNPFKFIDRLFSEPLILAKYDEDGEHRDPITGEMVSHKAGENKLNSNGEYYFETLGGRSIAGKKVLSLGDILTKEDSAINKYDFFDSDDMEKSPEGVIAKNLAAIAPMAFLGPWYSGFYVGREILKSLPMLYNISTMLSDSAVPESVNTLAGWAQSLTGGTSEYSQSKTFSFENFGNLISDVALQWGQQKFIANTISKIKNSNKTMLDVAKAKAVSEYEKQATNILNRAGANGMSIRQAQDITGVKSIEEIKDLINTDAWVGTVVGQKAIEKHLPKIEELFSKRTKLGQDLSLIYMAIISNTDVYDSMIEHGATKREAACAALGSTAGMFAVDKYLGLGEMFFDDEKAAARRLYRQSLKESLDKDVKPVIGRLGSETSINRESKNNLLNIFNTAKKSASNFVKDYHYQIKDRSLGLLGKSVGEGLEEVSEELVTDMVKSMYELGGQFGWFSQTDVGSWDNASDRYLMSLFGGAIGGAMFGAVDAIRNPKSSSDKNTQRELIHLVKEGRTQDILKELAVMRDRGLLGSKELSINTTSKEQGNTFVTADENNISQNDFIYNQMKTAIQQMDKIINGNQLNLNEDQLFERLVLSDVKLLHLKEFLQNGTYMSGYFGEYEKIVNDIYNNEVQIQKFVEDNADPKKRTETYQEDLQKLLDRREELNNLKEDFFKNKTQRYLRKTMFGTNADISGALLPMTYKQYVQLKFGKQEEYLTETQKAEAKELYDKYVKNKKQKDFDEAFDAWEKMTKQINPTLQDLDLGEIDVWEQARKEMSEFIPAFEKVNYDERINPLKIDVDEELGFLHVIRTSEYDKPWRSDPTRSNKAFDLQLEERPDLFFQIVKDEEDKYWSIHFKTDNKERNEENPSYSALSNEQKKRLFRAAALVIPEGEYISTHGELTKGGISGLNRFGQTDFVGLKFVKTGERNVKTKGANSFEVQVTGVSKSGATGDGKYVGTRDSDGFWHIKHEGANISKRGMNREEMEAKGVSIEDVLGEKDSWTDETQWEEASKNLEYFKVVNITLRPDGSISLQIIDDGGDSYMIEGASALKLYYILFSDFDVNQYDPQDIAIPIWQKNTGETDEEYNNRNTKLDSEDDTQFETRKKARFDRLLEQYEERQYELLKKLIESDATIDTNTYRQLVVLLGKRAKDIKISNLRKFLTNDQNYGRIQEVLEKLNDDFSNKDEIWEQIQEILYPKFEEEFQEKLDGINEATILPDDLKSKDFITFDDILNFFLDNGKDVLWTDDVDFGIDTRINVAYLTDSGLDSEVQNDIRNLYNIQKYLENPNPNGITLFGNPIILEDGSEYKESITNKVRLQQIASKIKSKYITEEGKSANVLYTKKFKNDNFEKYISFIKDDYFNLINSIQKNNIYDTLLKLPSKIESKNKPTLKLLKSIADKIGLDFSDIESTLQSIVERYNGLAEASDFRLTDPQIEALENAFNLIELAKAAIVAASGSDSYFTPWNYNKTINEWNKAHKSEIDGDIEELPELDDNVANVLLQDLHQYQREINLWIKRARQNGINKVKMFEEFDNKFESVKFKFVMDNRDKMKLDDGTDLLEGFSEIPNNPKESVLEFERVFYANVQKALANGKSEEDLFKIFDKFINWNEAIKQKTSKLDLNLAELTDYDKFVYLISCMNYNPDNFYTDYKNFVESNKQNIAPLSFQKHAIRIIKSQQNNPNFVNKMLELFKDKTNFEGVILYNTSIITGIGGSGKTSVVAKGVGSDSILLSGPTDEQNVNLKACLGDFTSYNRTELLKFILESQYDKFNSEQQTNKSGELLKIIKTKDTGNIFDISKVSVKKLDNPPKQLIIDESTLYSNAELQVISKFCKENNINLLLIGDENQNSNMSTGWNLQRENTLAVRAPKLGMSLRETNLWKYQNYDTLQNLEDSLRDTDSTEETRVVRDRLISSDLKKYKLKYYLKDDLFFGDMINSGVLLEQQLNVLKNSDKVCFVGSTSSDVYKQLQGLGTKIEVKSLEEVQGREYPYVVVDLDWKQLSKNINTDPESLLNFMQVLYTMLTRSQNGTIFIDNGLTDIIGPSEAQSYNSLTVNLDKSSILRFSEKELKWLNEHTWNPVTLKSEEKALIDIKPETHITVPEDNTSSIINPVSDDNEDSEEIDGETPISYNQTFQIHTYTNLNYLGINRKLVDGKGIWFNENDSYRDIGIFLRKGNELKTDEDKQLYVNKLLDLKSAILFDKLDASYGSNPFLNIPIDNVKKAKYFVVKETFDPQIHHHLTIEQNLKELPPGTVFYTLQARFKDADGNECSITLATLPDPSNIHKEIYKNQFQRELDKLEDTEENKELRDWYNKLLTDERFLDSQFNEFKNTLNSITDEREINKPNLVKMTGLRYIRDNDGKIYHLRLEEVNSFKSRYSTRSSAYVISPIYTAVERGMDKAGKPFILVSADRSLSSSDLITTYEEQQDDSSLPITVRKVMLDSMGVSFESLFDYRYKDLFTTQGRKDNDYTFPFDLLPIGMRMYVALHNFRANLLKLDQKIKESYPDQKKLIAIAKEESRLFLEHKADGNPNLTNTQFKNWINSNPGVIKNGVTLDDIKGLWEFNETSLKDVKQFRIGYSEDNGVYVRNIAPNYNGNYINPEIAEQWLSTIQKIFDIVLDKIIPPDSLKNIKDITEITDYRKLADQEETWAKKLREYNEITFTLKEEDSDEDVTLSIPSKNGIRAIPIVLCQIVKNLQSRRKMSNSQLDSKFSDYTTNPESKYAVKFKNDEGEETFIPYLEVLKGGLGEIGHKTDSEPGVRESVKNKGVYYDFRLINMFNVMFHGAVSLWENKENRNDFLQDRESHAKDVLFPYGFFVDPIISGKYDEDLKHALVGTSIKFYAANIAPSGVKTFIDFRPVEEVTTSRSSSSTQRQDDKEIRTLLNTLNSLFKSNNWIKANISTKEGLIKEARREISSKLNIHFGTSSTIDSLDKLLNIPINITDDGNIIRIKDDPKLNNLSGSAKIKQIGQTFEISDIDYIYTINKNGSVTKKPRIISINTGIKEVSPIRFKEYWEEYVSSSENEDNDGEYIITSLPPDDLDYSAQEFNEISQILSNDDEDGKNRFKAKIKRLFANEDVDNDDLDTLLDNYINDEC